MTFLFGGALWDFFSKVKCVVAQKTLGNTGLNNQHCVLKGERQTFEHFLGYFEMTKYYVKTQILVFKCFF